MTEPSQIAQIAPISPDWRHLAEVFCSLGAGEEQLAELFSVSQDTIAGWMTEIPAFAHAVRCGRNLAIGHVADTVHRLAVGYSHPVERVLKGADGPVIVRYIKHYPPKWKACKIWLENKRPQDWGAANVKRKLQEWKDARDDAARRPPSLSNAALATLLVAHGQGSSALDQRRAADLVGTGERQSLDEPYGAAMGMCRTVVERVAAQGVLGWFGTGLRHGEDDRAGAFDLVRLRDNSDLGLVGMPNQELLDLEVLDPADVAQSARGRGASKIDARRVEPSALGHSARQRASSEAAVLGTPFGTGSTHVVQLGPVGTTNGQDHLIQLRQRSSVIGPKQVERGQYLPPSAGGLPWTDNSDKYAAKFG